MTQSMALSITTAWFICTTFNMALNRSTYMYKNIRFCLSHHYLVRARQIR